MPVVFTLQRQLVYALLNIAGADHRQDDLFSTETLLAKGFNALKGLKVCFAEYVWCCRVHFAV